MKPFLRSKVILLLIWLGILDGIGAESKPANATQMEALKRMVDVRPTPSQLVWQRQEITAFIHFGINTFHDGDWGTGKENPAEFHPTALDCRQWASVCRDFGAGSVILVAKHHDGFCLWPSAYTDHSVKSSPWLDGKGDVVRQLADACNEFGLGLGLYVSPADVNHPAYGLDHEAYNEHFKAQLRELLTNYGPVREIWFDGAEPGARRQQFDWQGFYAVIKALQPDCLISIRGPDTRWVGNERGIAREAEWSVLPLPCTADQYDWPNLMGFVLGGRDQLKDAVSLHWYPAVAAVSLRPSWFYQRREDLRARAVADLAELYFTSVGRNAVMLLNLSPDKRGVIPDRDVTRLNEWALWKRATFHDNLIVGAQIEAGLHSGIGGHPLERIIDGKAETWWQPQDWSESVMLTFLLPKSVRFDLIQLKEAIQAGQRIEAFVVEIWDGKNWQSVANGQTIGYQRLLSLQTPISTDRLRIRIEQFRVAPTLAEIGLFLQASTESR